MVRIWDRDFRVEVEEEEEGRIEDDRDRDGDIILDGARRNGRRAWGKPGTSGLVRCRARVSAWDISFSALCDCIEVIDVFVSVDWGCDG